MPCFAETGERSLAYAEVRESLRHLAALPAHACNWRPNLVVLPQAGDESPGLLEYAVLLGGRHGIVSRISLVQGRPGEAATRREAELSRRRQVVADWAAGVFDEVVVAPDPEAALPVVLQAHAIGPLKPNIAMLAYPGAEAARGAFVARLRPLVDLKINPAVLLCGAGQAPPLQQREGRIDIWWRGRANGSLMLILAHLLTLNPLWQRVGIRVLRIAGTDEEQAAARDEMKRLITASGIAAEIRVPVSSAPFSVTMRRESRDALAVFLGFVLPSDPAAVAPLFGSTARALEGMPPAFLVSNSGAADLLA